MSGRRKAGSSRRGVLKLGAGLAAAAPFAPLLATAAAAQNADAELAALQQGRPIRLARGIVLTLDRGVGDFASADVLIEGGKISAIGQNIMSPPGTVVVDCVNRIIVPGFVDTHVHSYQGLLRSTLPNGLVDPDYNRDIQNNLTLAYSPADVHIGELITALALIDMGTTTIVDIAQISHSPEHSDACIRGLQESGIRAVHAYSRGAGPNARYPQDIGRLQRTYFNSRDQLLTLAMAVSTDPSTLSAAREAGVPAVLHIRVESGAVPAARPRRAFSRRRFVHPCDAHERRGLAPHQGDGRTRLAVSAARDGDGSWLPRDAGRARPRCASELELGSLGNRRPGYVRRHALGVCVPAPQYPAETNAERAERSAASDMSRGAGIRHRRRGPLRQSRLEDRYAVAGQGCRHRRAEGRPPRSLAGQQRVRHRRQSDEPEPCRVGLHRRKGEEVARDFGGRRHGARHAPRKRGA